MDNNEYRTSVIYKAHTYRKQLESKKPFKETREFWELIWTGEQLSLMENDIEILRTSVDGTVLNKKVSLKKRIPTFVEKWLII